MGTDSYLSFQFLIGRLVTIWRGGLKASIETFQFLIGRLVTMDPPAAPGELLWFQFLIGRLVTHCNVGGFVVGLGFNSS